MNPSEYREIVRDYLTNHNKKNIPLIYQEEGQLKPQDYGSKRESL